MIEAFELGVALTLETDAARAALTGVGQQLSTLDRDMVEFEKRMMAMPAALGRLAVPQSPLGNENVSPRSEHLEPSSPASSRAPNDQRYLQSTANLWDYLAVPHATAGAFPKAPEADLYANSQPMFGNILGLDSVGMAPMTTDMLGAVSLPINDIMSQATALARASALLVGTASVPHETESSMGSLQLGDGGNTEFAPQIVDRGETGTPALMSLPARGDYRSSALTGQDDSTAASLQNLLRVVSNEALPMSALQGSTKQFNADKVQHVFEAVEHSEQDGGLPDRASWSLPLTSPYAWTATDTREPFGLSSGSRINAGFMLPGGLQADSAGGRVTAPVQSWGSDIVPPTFAYPTLPAENAAEAHTSPERRGRTGVPPEEQSDGESISNPLVIHTNVHIDGDVVARVVSEKMVAWMNGPLAGTGGFDARRSYTPVES